MRPLVLAIVTIVALAAVADAQTTTISEIQLGDQVSGVSPGSGEPVIIPFLGLEGSLVNLSVKADSGSFPNLEVLRPNRMVLPLGALAKQDKKGKKLTVKKLPLPGTGLYYLLLRTASQGGSNYTLKTSAKLPKKYKDTVAVPASNLYEQTFPAMPGAQFSVSIKAGKFSQLIPRIAAVRSPDANGAADSAGAAVDLSTGKRKTKGSSDKLSKLGVPLFGDYTVQVMAGEDSLGDLANFSIKAKQPKPRKSKLEAGNIRVNPVVDSITIPAPNGNKVFDNQDPPIATIRGSFFQPGATVTLVRTYDEEWNPVTTGVIEPEDGTLDRTSHQRIVADFDFTDESGSDLMTGMYEVVVVNPDGTEGRIACDPEAQTAPVTFLRAPRTTGLTPTLTWDGSEYRETLCRIDGNYLWPNATVEFVPDFGDSVNKPQVVPGSVTSFTTRLEFRVNTQGVDLGSYFVELTNPDAGTTTLTQKLTVFRAPRVHGIDRTYGYDNESFDDVTLSGDYLVNGAGLSVSFVPRGVGTPPTVSDVKWVSTQKLTFDVDLNGATPGLYDVMVRNPDGGQDRVDSLDDEDLALEVRRAPSLAAGSHTREYVGATIDPFSFLGSGFQTDALAYLENGGGEKITPANLTFEGAGTLNGVIDLTGVTAGPWSLVVENPSSKSGQLPGVARLDDAFYALGGLPLVTGEIGADQPSIARDPARDRYLVVWRLKLMDGSTDIRARLIDAETGAPAGDELEITDTSDENERQPHVAYDPDADRYFITFVTDSGLVLGRVVGGDGSTTSTEVSIADESGKTVNWPRVTYNGDDREFFVVYERSSGGKWNVEGVRIPAAAGFGTPVQFSVTVWDLDQRDPDVLYEPNEEAYVIVYSLNLPEPAPEPGLDPPPDTKMDIASIQYARNTTTPISGSLSIVWSTVDDERYPRLARDGTDEEMLIVWERNVSGTNGDIWARRYEPTRGGRMRDDPYRVEQEATATVDARRPHLTYDEEAGAYRVAYVVGGTDVTVTALPVTGGSAVHTLVAPGAAKDDATEFPAIATRSKDGESIVVFAVGAGGVSGRNLQAHSFEQ